MPTTLPRAQVTFDPETYETLEAIAKKKHTSLSALVSEMVEAALELAEDQALCEIGAARLKSFNRDDALSIDEVIKWNAARRDK